nr:hypothetical protein [Tanacetum cinerariifolium]
LFRNSRDGTDRGRAKGRVGRRSSEESLSMSIGGRSVLRPSSAKSQEFVRPSFPPSQSPSSSYGHNSLYSNSPNLRHVPIVSPSTAMPIPPIKEDDGIATPAPSPAYPGQFLGRGHGQLH